MPPTTASLPSIGIVASPSPAWTQALGVSCPRHSVARGTPCWTLPSQTSRRSHQAVCAWRVSAAQSLRAARDANAANAAREVARHVKAAEEKLRHPSRKPRR